MNRFTPEMLEPYHKTAEFLLRTALCPKPEALLTDLFSHEASENIGKESFEAFQNDLNNGNLTPIAESCLKKSTTVQPDKFFLFTKMGTGSIPNIDSFGPDPGFLERWCDGNYNFILSYRDKEDIWLSMAGFSAYPFNKETNRKSPMIKQLQVFPYKKNSPENQHRIEIAKQIRQGIRWELLGTKIVIEFAYRIGASAVYIQPGDLNIYAQANELSLERAQRRYDFTASECGFTLDEHDYWRLQLPWSILHQPMDR